MARILILDDDAYVRDVLSGLARSMNHTPFCFSTLEEGKRISETQEFELIFLDLDFPDGNGLDALPGMVHAPYFPQVIVITGKGTKSAAEIAFRYGAWDFITKPFDLDEVGIYISWALKCRSESVCHPHVKFFRRDGIVGESSKLKACIEHLIGAAESQANVLITGESGTGKELFAKALHDNSSRSEGPFIVADCGAMPESLAESTLFGHEKGAFTGAVQSRKGLVGLAHKGTLFLDEIGELPKAIQTRFLRVLQEKRFRPVGSEKEADSDFRLVAATHRNLDRSVEEGLFRQDLLFRIKTVSIHLPPLRERREDIPSLVSFQLNRLSSSQGTEIKCASTELITALSTYNWPGNIRELMHAVERAFVAARHHKTIYPVHLPPEIRARGVYKEENGEAAAMVIGDSGPAKGAFSDSHPTLQEYLSAAEKCYFEALMLSFRENREEAVRVSGLSQSQLYRRLKELGIHGFRKPKR